MAVADSEGSASLPEDIDQSDQSPIVPLIKAPAMDQLIERWWGDHFPGSAIARDTQAWNVAHAAKEMLKRLLKGSI
jgi:hypothetical protein